MFDLLIKNGIVVDGSGEKPHISDIAVKEGTIKQIEKSINGKATTIVEAKGLVVSPGFIDPHSHTDLTVSIYPSSARALRQGITTEVVGNCGLSSAPLSCKNRDYWKKYMNFQGQNEFKEFNPTWSMFSDYLQQISQMNIGTNLAHLVGHNTLRSYVMGTEDNGGKKQSPTDNELKKMKNELTEAYKNGAFGLSTGLSYPVGRNAPTWEIIELCRITSQHKKIYASHLRSGPDLLGYREFYDIIRETNVKGIISHVRGRTIRYPENNQKNSSYMVDEILNLFHSNRRGGYEVYMDVIPIPSGLNSLSSTLFGGWGLSDTETVFDDQGKLIPLQKFLTKLADPEKRQKLKDSIQNNLNTKVSYEKDTRLIHYSENNDQYTGKTIRELSTILGLNELDTIIDILLSSNGDTRWGNTCIEEDLDKLFLNSDAIPCSDGHSLPSRATTKTIGGIPGPRIFGAFPYFINKYKKFLSIEEIITRSTYRPAKIFNIKNRGLLKSEYFADIVLFDPGTISNNATYGKPALSPEGIKMVIQNGKISIRKGKTVSLEGKVLKSDIT